MDLNQSVKNHKDGVAIDIFVTTGSKHSIFPTGYNKWRKRLNISIVSEAKDNKANKEILEKIANYFKINKKDILLISGEKNKEKTILIKNKTKKNLLDKITEDLNGF